MFLGGPGPIAGIRDHPKTKASLAVVDLIDDFDQSAIGAGHDFRPGRERNGGNPVEQDANFAAHVEERRVDSVSHHLNGFVGARRRKLHEFIPGTDGFSGPGVSHFHHGAIDRGEDAASEPALFRIGHPQGDIGQLIGGFGRVADGGLTGRFGIKQSLQDIGADLVAAKAEGFHRLSRAFEVGLRPGQIGFGGERRLDGQLEFALRHEALLRQLFVPVHV